MIVFGGIIVLITTLSLKRLDFRPEAVNARGDNGFVDPRFCFHLRISCHQKGMILFLGNRWKSSFFIMGPEWIGTVFNLNRDGMVTAMECVPLNE